MVNAGAQDNAGGSGQVDALADDIAGDRRRGRGIPSLASFEPAWRLRLRRPLTDPPPAAARAVTAKSVKRPTLPVRLIGTIVDGEHPRGLFMSGLSTVELKGLGEVSGGANILAIDENSATSCEM